MHILHSRHRFRKYLLPGLVFQSVVIAGGYGTGREIVEFFLSHGPVGGLLAMLLATAIWSVVSAVSFELARTIGSHDYRTFFRSLLGPAWVVFEVGYITLMLLVLAVIGAAAGSMLEQTFGLPYAAGVLAIMVAVGVLVFRGSATIERVLTAWSFVLYGVFGALFVWSIARFGPAIATTFREATVDGGWVVGGLQYAAYNLSVIPAILFVVRHLERREEALGAGLLAGVIGMAPGFLFFVAMTGHYPQILAEAVSVNFLLVLLGSRTFQIGFQIVLFGTLIETGTGLIHAVNERIARARAERGAHLVPAVRPALAVGFLVIATLLARFGLIDLIARGYGTLTWLFLIVYVIPVVTIGVWKIARNAPSRRREAP